MVRGTFDFCLISHARACFLRVMLSTHVPGGASRPRSGSHHPSPDDDRLAPAAGALASLDSLLDFSFSPDEANLRHALDFRGTLCKRTTMSSRVQTERPTIPSQIFTKEVRAITIKHWMNELVQDGNITPFIFLT